MKGFFRVQTPDQVFKSLDRFSPLPSEEVGIEGALHRVLAEDVRSPVNLPGFRRSMVDGFAVKAKDTYGASEGNPAILRLAGEILMGAVSGEELKDGEAVKVATGGMVPDGADAVEMIEYAEPVDPLTLHVTRPLSPLENLVQVGEDVRAGEAVLSKGRRLKPQDIGLMAGIGKTVVRVFLRPRIAVLSSGDEVIPVEETPRPGQVRDINRFTVASMAREFGGVPYFLGIVKDRPDDLKRALRQGLNDADMVVVTGGSSVGTLDFTLEVLRSFSGAELMTHGISVRPGKPTLLAAIGDKPFLGLPGHPVSAMVIFRLFGKRIIEVLSGLSADRPARGERLRARAARNIPSGAGREDYVRVRLEEREGAFWAHPIFGKSGSISNLVDAEGLLKIGMNEEGLEQGEEAEVILL